MNTIWRIMDANTNRAREGLRVLEDVARFTKNNSRLTARFKKCRHDLSKIILALPKSILIKNRNSHRDVGKKSYLRDQKTASLHSLVASNFKRIQESLRALEECAAVVHPKSRGEFQALRFQIYELEKEAVTKF